MITPDSLKNPVIAKAWADFLAQTQSSLDNYHAAVRKIDLLREAALAEHDAIRAAYTHSQWENWAAEGAQAVLLYMEETRRARQDRDEIVRAALNAAGDL